MQEAQFEEVIPLQVAQLAWQQVEPTRVNEDEQEAHAVLPAPEHVKQDESQVLQAPPLVKYSPATQEEQLEEVVPLQVRQEAWQQVPLPLTKTNEDVQEVHCVRDPPLQVKHDEWQVGQDPLVVPVKYLPAGQEIQVLEAVPLQVAQLAWQQVPSTRILEDEQEVHAVRPAPSQVEQDPSQS